MISQQLTERGFVESRKPGSLCEGMFLGRDHQKEQVIDAHLFKTSTTEMRRAIHVFKVCAGMAPPPSVAVDMSLEAMTVQTSGGGVESPLKKTSDVRIQEIASL